MRGDIEACFRSLIQFQKNKRGNRNRRVKTLFFWEWEWFVLNGGRRSTPECRSDLTLLFFAPIPEIRIIKRWVWRIVWRGWMLIAPFQVNFGSIRCKVLSYRLWQLRVSFKNCSQIDQGYGYFRSSIFCFCNVVPGVLPSTRNGLFCLVYLVSTHRSLVCLFHGVSLTWLFFFLNTPFSLFLIDFFLFSYCHSYCVFSIYRSRI